MADSDKNTKRIRANVMDRLKRIVDASEEIKDELKGLPCESGPDHLVQEGNVTYFNLDDSNNRGGNLLSGSASGFLAFYRHSGKLYEVKVTEVDTTLKCQQ